MSPTLKSTGGWVTLGQNLRVFPLGQTHHVGVAKSERPRLTNGEIIFEEFQRIWSQFTNVTDGRTDRQTTCDRYTALCTKVHRAVKMYNTLSLDNLYCAECASNWHKNACRKSCNSMQFTVHNLDAKIIDTWQRMLAYQVVVVLWKELFAVVPACENSFAVRVVGDECDEPTWPRRQELNNTPDFWLRLSLIASVLTAARVRARVGYKLQSTSHCMNDKKPSCR